MMTPFWVGFFIGASLTLLVWIKKVQKGDWLMKENRRIKYNVGSYGPKLEWGRFGLLYYRKLNLSAETKNRDKWTNGPNTYYRFGRFCIRVRKEE